jgi:hypothetical protein
MILAMVEQNQSSVTVLLGSNDDGTEKLRPLASG